MTGYTIGQLGQHNRIVFKFSAVTTDTPAHIHQLWLRHRHLADFTVTIFAMQTGCNVRTVTEINEIWQYGNRYPWDWLVVLHVCCQFIDF